MVHIVKNITTNEIFDFAFFEDAEEFFKTHRFENPECEISLLSRDREIAKYYPD